MNGVNVNLAVKALTISARGRVGLADFVSTK